MLGQLTPKERFGYVTFACVILLVVGYVGAQHLQSQPSVVVQNGAPPAGGSWILVDVSGKVKKPGVYRLAPDKRVNDAIQAAGGLLPDADLLMVNQAAKLEDGEKLIVPAKGSTVAAPVVGSEDTTQASIPEDLPKKGAATGGHRAATEKKKTPANSSISLNTANKAKLCELPGVGPATATRILEYRTSHGGFRSIDELLAVKGIGDKKLAKMRPFLRL